MPNVEKVLRSKIRALEEIPRDALIDEAVTERARMAARDVIGEVTVLEGSEHVYANVDLGRCI